MHRIMDEYMKEKEAKQRFQDFVFCSNRRVKKYTFLAKLNEEIGVQNKISIYA